VVEAESGEQAIGIANAERPDLILLDIVMSGIGGVEVLRRLKADPATADISVVVLSAQAETELVK
jgi:CheY-like chemotaxis protein